MMKMCEEGKKKRSSLIVDIFFISVHSLLLDFVTCYCNQQIFRYIGEILGNVDITLSNNFSCA